MSLWMKLKKAFSFEQLPTGKEFGRPASPDFTLDHRLPLPRRRPSGPPKEVQFTTIGTISLLTTFLPKSCPRVPQFKRVNIH